MKRLRYIMIVALLGLFACQQQIEIDGGQGELQLTSFSVDTQYQTVGNATTKADDNSIQEHIFSVDIYDNATDEIVQSYASHRDVPATIVLPIGSYTIEAYTANVNSQVPFNNTAGFEQPQYGATQEVDIIAGQTTPISMTATPITAAITVGYSDAFKHLYPCSGQGESYYTIVYSSHGAELLFNNTETRTAYFKYTGKGMELLYKVYIIRLLDDGSLETITTQEPISLLGEGVEAQAGYLYNTTITVQGE